VHELLPGDLGRSLRWNWKSKTDVLEEVLAFAFMSRPRGLRCPARSWGVASRLPRRGLALDDLRNAMNWASSACW